MAGSTSPASSPRLPLAPFAPDLASIDTAVTRVARNVVPRADGYGPIPSPVPITQALPDACRGAVAVRSPVYGVTTYFAGTQSKLYRLDLTAGGWIDATGGTAVGVPPGGYWSFALYGNRLVATPATGPSLVIDVDRGRAFAPLGGNPPRARFSGVVGGFLVLAGLAADANSLQWSDLENIERWTPGLQGQSGDLQTLPDGGPVTGFAGGEFGLVFQDQAIRRMTYNPGSRTVFDFSVAERNRGCVSPSALVQVGGQVFFVDREGFFVFRGGESAPIGAERVNRYFRDDVDPNALAATVALRDPTGRRVLFAYRTKAAPVADPSLLDRVLLYDWGLDRWTSSDLALRYGMAAASPGTSIDALPGNVDTMSKTFDSPDYLGGEPALGVFGADNRLSLLRGAPLEARFETADAFLSRPNRTFVTGLRIDTDADDIRVAVGARETARASDPVVWQIESAPTVERFHPCRSDGRYHRAAIRIPAGTNWTYASAVEAKARPMGLR